MEIDSRNGCFQILFLCLCLDVFFILFCFILNRRMIVLQGCVGFCCTMKISHNWEFWQNMVHWRREQQTTSDSCLENTMNSMKRQKDTTLKDELPRSVGAQNATGDQWRNNSRKNEETEPSKNNTQLWMWLVMEAKSNAVKSNITWEPGMLSSVQFSRSVVRSEEHTSELQSP